MNYELAKELKNAGFGNYKEDIIDAETGKKFTDIYHPTLSELIEACGDEFYGITVDSQRKWHAWRSPSQDGIDSYSTPEEAVARLWLAINKKT